jgi:hypothetical protein
LTLKTLAIAAAAGLTLLALSTTAIVLRGHATTSMSPARVHLSAGTLSQHESSPSPAAAQNKSDNDEQGDNDNDEQGDNDSDEQGEDDDKQGSNQKKDADEQHGSTHQGDDPNSVDS